MTMDKLRWGILGTANIARKNWKAIHHSGNGTLVAVASRDLERSRRFIDECQAAAPMDSNPRALGSYEELMASPDVDAVYIPLPTGLRKEWVLRAAAAGKHIICEKPCATSASDLQEMIEACRRHGVQFMDGVMFMHSRRLPRMREILGDGQSVGEIRRITSSFSFCAPPEFFAGNIRARSEMEPHGCLGDLGWYCVRFALWAMNWSLPQRVTGLCLHESTAPGSRAGVPTEFSGELFFGDGASSGFYCSFITANEQCATVSGTKGYLRVSDFVLPFHGSEVTFEVNNAVHKVSGCDFKMQSPWRRFSVAEHSDGDPSAQEANLFRNFAEQVRSGRVNESWPEIALKTQRVIDACFVSAHEGNRPVELENNP
jgi:predicted dehydrogenase